MGKRGQPVDAQAMEEKRETAIRLLRQGVAPMVVRQQLGVSKTWIYKVRQEAADVIAEGERRSGSQRRSGEERRLNEDREVALGMPGERRSGHDRRGHRLYS